MPSCQYTTLIPSSQCIGDSLRTINSNFTILNDELCKIPRAVGDEKDTFVTHEMDLLGCNNIKLELAPKPTLYKKFDSISSNITLSSCALSDGFTTDMYVFPYISSLKDSKPIGTFDAISENGSPQLTLFWTASSNNAETVFATNSSVSFGQRGSVSPDGPVHCFCEVGNMLYIGGEFNNIGTTTSRKFATINSSGGDLHNELGNVGVSAVSLFDGVNGNAVDFGETGSVNFIKNTSITIDIDANDIRDVFIIGGSFRSPTAGRSLTVWDNTSKKTYQFYVNGSLHDCAVVGSDLYVVGRFDFVNFGVEADSMKSGKRYYSKSIVKISLIKLLNNQQHNCIDSAFCQTIQSSLTNVCGINCIAETSNQLFIGGDFFAEIDGLLNQQNLMALTLTGEIVQSIKLIVNKPVFTLAYDVDVSVLYVGGEFTKIVQQSVFSDPLNQPVMESEGAYLHAAAFDVQIEQAPVLMDWKPRFNGAVRKIEIQNVFINSNIYAIGDFTQINDEYSGHAAAVTKASDPLVGNNIGAKVDWAIETPTAPTRNTNALLKGLNGVYIGGTFTKIGGTTRFYFSKVAGAGETAGNVKADVVWDFGGKVLTANEPYSLIFNEIDTVRSKTLCKRNDTVNVTTFAPLRETFQNQRAGRLCRFFIRRPCYSGASGKLDLTDDTYTKSVKIIGWSLSYV